METYRAAAPSPSDLIAQPEAELRAALARIPCPLAAGASGKLLLPEGGGSRSWDGLLQELDLVLAGDGAALDFLACVLPVPLDGCGIGDLAAAVHALLLHLSSPADLYAGIEAPAWTLRTRSGEYFPLLMSAFYPEAHPRYLEWPTPVLLLQPEESFGRRGISSSWGKREELSLTVERRFRQLGREYFGEITRRLPKSLRVIKPLRSSDEPVRWWRYPPAIPPC